MPEPVRKRAQQTEERLAKIAEDVRKRFDKITEGRFRDKINQGRFADQVDHGVDQARRETRRPQD